ncbi:MAG TPA: response regulator [Casimicrobiaceae bacterium]|jgi:DNA-binding NarL/FixJ family response regulator
MAMSNHQPRIYLVEDSPIILNLLIELIQATNANIVGHSDSAKAAVADIDALHPDVITIDLLLKRGNGFDVLKEIAKKKPDERPLRIVLTNYTTDAYRDAAQRLGVEHFFDKATEIRKVLSVLTSMVSSSNQGAVAA